MKEQDIKVIETSRDYTANHPRILLAKQMQQEGEGVRVTENYNIIGRFKIEYTTDGLTAFGERVNTLRQASKNNS